MINKEGKLVLTAEDRTGQAFDSVDRRLAGLSGAVSRARLLIPAAAISSVVAATKAAISHADAVGDQARRLQLTASSYQELSYAAKQLDVDQAALDAGISRFNRTLGEARIGSKKAYEDFQKLGLDPKKFKNTDEALNTVIKRLSQVKDGAERGAMAARFFGKEAGDQFADVVSNSADKLERLRREAHEVGAVLSDETVAKADAAASKFDKLADITRTQLAVAFVELAPIVTSLGEAAAMSAKGWALLFDEITNFVKAKRIEELEEELKKLSTGTMESWTRKFETFASGFAFMAGPRPRGPLPIGPLSPESQARMEEIHRELDALRGGGAAKDAGKDRPATRTRSVTATGELDKERQAAEKLLETYSDLDPALRKLTDAQDLANQLLAKGKMTSEEYSAAIEGIQKAYENLGAEQEQTETRLSIFADQAARNIQNITADLLKGEIAAKNFGRSMLKMLSDIAAELAAQQLLTGLFNLFGTNAQGVGYGTALFGGKRASGGPVERGKLYEVNERGPEVLSAGGRDFLMMGGMRGFVQPNRAVAAAPSHVVYSPTFNINASGGTSAAQIQQMHAALRESNRQVLDHLERKRMRGD